MTANDLGVTFLQDGRQSAESVAAALIGFFGGATSSLDIAIYDCALDGELGGQVATALRECARRRVAVRFAYFGGPHRSPIIPPPKGSSQSFTSTLGVPVRPISGFRGLMHHKYVVRDAGTGAAVVWTGSTNWTLDAWDREENVIVQIPSDELADRYRADFEELWSSGRLEDTGMRDGGPAGVQFGGQAVTAHVWFSPGEGEDMAHAVADAISDARRRIIVSSPVLTDGIVLGALRDAVRAGRLSLSGVVDATQMAEVRQQWGADPVAAWKLNAFDEIARAGHFAGKHSASYAPGSVHDYMHAKSIVVDDIVFTGSYNFSHSGETNAENLLTLECDPLADEFAGFTAQLIQRYPPLFGG